MIWAGDTNVACEESDTLAAGFGAADVAAGMAHATASAASASEMRPRLNMGNPFVEEWWSDTPPSRR